MQPETFDLMEWNASCGGDFLWNSTNFGEAITEVMTPLTWSVIQFTLDDWVYVPGYPSVGNIGGYPYLNISVFITALQAIGRQRQDLLAMMEGALYMNLPEGMEIPGVPVNRRASFLMLPNLLRVQLKLKQGERRLPVYLAENPAWFSKTKEQLHQTKTNSELLALWQQEIRPHIKRGVWTVLGASMASSEYTAGLRQKLTTLAGSEIANLLIANVSETTGLLPSLGVVVGLSQVASGEMTRQDYLQRYGHRGPHEFELAKPRPVENPGWMDSQVAHFRASPVDLNRMQAKQRAAFERAWQRFHSQYPNQATSIRRQLAESARRANNREQARSEYVRDRWFIRLFALQASLLNDLGEDIFFLTLPEVLGLLAGERTVTRRIPARRETYQHLKNLPPYPSTIRGYFNPLRWVGGSGPRSDIYEERPTANKDIRLSNQIQGAPGSAGQVEGLVRVIERPESGTALQQGEILVAVQTDVAWTLLFPRAAAVITDVGAPLSHAAIVARELGIPAVVGCGDATARLKTGDRVRVDGSRGIVEILP